MKRLKWIAVALMNVGLAAKVLIALALVFLVMPDCCFGQSSIKAHAKIHRRKAPAAQTALADPVHLSAPNTVPDGFPVRIRVTEDLQPKVLKPGEEVPFVLASDLYFRTLLLAEKGHEVKAVVKGAHRPRSFGRGSQLTIQVESAILKNGDSLPLRSTPSAQGGMDASMLPLQGIEGVFGATVFPPASIVSLLLLASPGTNSSIPQDAVITAFVDGNTKLDIASLLRQQPPTPSTGTARIRVVRGIRGRHLGADLFCNGTPVAHIGAGQFLDLNLRAGWYRFSIRPDHPNVLIYAVPGRTYFLLSDLRSIREADLNEANLNTIGFGRGGRNRTLAGLMAESKPVNSSDLYASTCSPLAEEISVDEHERPNVHHTE